jgi:alanyl-tRNA synthetase
MRVSGKHNDLENVGRTARHHTFFEMLGNFSFGDYFKKEAIAYSWEFLMKRMDVDAKRLWVTVYEEDDDAHELWLKMNVLPGERIRKLGKEENFWAMGETGPCGPCSEIHYDWGEEHGCKKPSCSAGCECGRYVELWNLVFMQYNRTEGGKAEPLAKPSVDTGMGIERIAAATQDVFSNYETDLFQPLILAVEGISKHGYKDSDTSTVSMNVIADHARALTFLISDGVTPSNEGRGYVLRKIMRRAMKHGRYVGLEEPFLHRLVETVAGAMADEYPELRRALPYVEEVCESEERKFADTLAVGMNLLENLFEDLRAKGEKVIPGSEAFRLYDTYGFPLDLTVDVARDRGFEVDGAGFEACLAKQREAARRSWRAAAPRQVEGVYRDLAREKPIPFLGYESLEVERAEVLAILRDGKRVECLVQGQEGEVVLNETPFYAEAGGQVGDAGALMVNGTLVEVRDTQKPVEGLVVHKARVQSGRLRTGDFVRARVDAARRRDTMANHTATHLLHAALRETLGEHVKQSGSLVAPDRLRFDFSHFKQVPPDVLRAIEDRVNDEIRADKTLEVEEMTLDEALARGAMALFGENYGERVRVLTVPGFSVELCGGTHTRATGEIGLFKFTEERGVASGVRRVEALTGRGALARIQRDWEILSRATERLNAPREDVLNRLEALRRQAETYEKEIERLKIAAASGDSEGKSWEKSVREVSGVRVFAREVRGLDPAGLRGLSDRFMEKLGSGVVVLGCHDGDKTALLVSVSKDLTPRLHAGKIIKELAPLMDGTGGGKPTLGQAGGKSPEKLASALERSYAVIGEYVKKPA